MNKKKLLIGAVIIAIIVAAYFYFKKKKATAPAADTKLSLDPNFNIAIPDTRNDSFPLHTNSKGERVKTLQLALNRLITAAYATPGTDNKIPALVADGIFGEQTKTAILKVVGVAFYGSTGVTETQFNSIIEKSNK